LEMNSHNRWMTTLTVLLGSMAMGLSATMPMVALPAMMETFGVGQATIQWMITGFQVMATTPVLATGWLSARFGLRRTYLGTLLLFIVFSILGAMTTSISVAITARVAQGTAMGLIPAVALIAIARAFPANALGLAMGVFGVGAVLAPAIGPYLAGLLLEPLGWQVIFIVPLLLCFPALLLTLKYVPGLEPGLMRKRFDWIGMVLVTGFIFAMLNVSGLGLAFGWKNWRTLGCLGLAVVMFAAFVISQLRSQAPLLELALFRNRSFRAVLTIAVLYGFCLYGASYLIPYFLQSVAGYSPEESGAMQVPGGIVLVLVIFLAGLVCDRLGARTVICAGLLIFISSYLCFFFISINTGFWMVVTWYTLNRVGMGILIPSISVAAIQSVSVRLLPYATTTATFFMGLGGAVGINAFSILYQWRLERGMNSLAETPGNIVATPAFSAFQTCFWLAAVILVIALAAVIWIRRGDTDPSIQAQTARS